MVAKFEDVGSEERNLEVLSVMGPVDTPIQRRVGKPAPSYAPGSKNPFGFLEPGAYEGEAMRFASEIHVLGLTITATQLGWLGREAGAGAGSGPAEPEGIT